MTDQAQGAAAPAAPTNSGQPVRTGPVESPIPRGKSERENVADFFDILGADPSTPNTRPKKKNPPVQARNTPHEEIEDRAFESPARAGDNSDLEEDDGGQGLEEEQEPTRQRDDDAPPDDSQEIDDGAEPGDPNTDENDDEQLLNRRVKVKADGKEFDVTIAELKNGYQRHQDYSRKTAEVATQRQALEQHTTEVLLQRQALDGLLLNAAQFVAQQMPQRPTPEQWDRLSRENPLEFTRLDAAWRRHDQQQAEIAQWRHANALEARTYVETQTRAGLDKEAQRLFQKFPDWKDPAKGAAVKQQLQTYAKTKYGMDTLAITNADHLEILFKAMRYDAAMERAQHRQAGARVTRQPANTPRAEAPQQRAAPPRPATPGAEGESRGKPKPDKLAQAKARQQRTHRDEDSVAAFDALLSAGR